MENVYDFLFQLMKHGAKTLHVAFIFLFRVYKSLCTVFPSLPLADCKALLREVAR